MFRAGVIGLAAILLIAAGPIQPSIQAPKPRPEQKTQSQTPAARHHDDAQRHDNATPTRVFLLNADEIEKKAARYQREQQEKAPTDWWTRAGVIAAIIIGLLQTGVFGYQAYKLRQTVKDGEAVIRAATLSAKAAQDQVDMTRKASEDQLRPYVHASEVAFKWGVAGPYGSVKIVNSGQTPATYFRIGCASMIGHTVETDAIVVPEIAVYDTWSALGGGETLDRVGVKCATLENHALTVKDSVSHKSRLFVLGRIVYGDIFGEDYETEFIYFIARDDIRQVIGGEDCGMRRFSGKHVSFRKINKPERDIET